MQPAARRASAPASSAAPPTTIVDLADDVDPERDHIRGRVDAPVTLLEYGDFECPYCGARRADRSRKLLDHLGDDLRYVFRHLPLTDVHPNAQMRGRGRRGAPARRARSGRCTTACWPTRTRSRRRDLYRHAAELGLDVDRFAEDLRRRRYAPRVAEDVQSADASGVSGTPTFFINGRRHQGVYDVDTLTRAVKAAAAPRPGRPRPRRHSPIASRP